MVGLKIFITDLPQRAKVLSTDELEGVFGGCKTKGKCDVKGIGYCTDYVCADKYELHYGKDRKSVV